MKHRFFVALPVYGALASAVAEWRERYARLPVRWLKDKDLHLTLVPPWYAEDPAPVIAELERLRGRGKISAEFRRVGYGPNVREPRLIWAEGPVPAGLPELQAEALRLAGQPAERRPLRLHITLARFRPENFPGLPVKRLEDEVRWPEEFAAVALVEAHLSPSGADYEILEEIPL